MADRQQTKLPSIGSAPAVTGPDQRQEKTRDAGAVAGAGKRSLPVPDAASLSLLPGPLVEPPLPGSADTGLLQTPQQALQPSPPALGTATTSPGPKSHPLTPGVINGSPLQARSQGLNSPGAKGLYTLHVNRLTEEELQYHQYEESQEDPDGSENYEEGAQGGHRY